MATRQAMAKVLGAVIDHFPGLVSGAADLTGNTGVKLPASAGQQTADDPGGRQVYYGIREHGMGAAAVGMAMHGGILPVTGTFFVFLDYMRPPVRLAGLSAGQGAVRVQPRLGRRRRGRPDAPAGRAPGDAAGDPRRAGHPPGRRQRDGGRVPRRRRPRRRADRRSCCPARACRRGPTARRSSGAPASSPTSPTRRS